MTEIKRDEIEQLQPGKDSGHPGAQIPKELEPVEVPIQNREGIKETNDVLKFLVSMGKAVKLSLADDKKVSLSDWPKFIEPGRNVFPAVAGISQVPFELADVITDEEIGQLKKTISDSGVLEGRSEDCVLEGLELIRRIKEFIYEYFVN